MAYLSCNDISFPTRSRLYSLAPLAIKTSLTESLTGYVERLAQEHSLATGILMEREIAPLIDRSYSGAHLHTIHSQTAALNGTGLMASNLVTALEKLTNQKNLKYLTLLPWSKLLPCHNLLRHYRVWCPLCYEEFRAFGKDIVEPLLWYVEAARVCPQHRQLLQSICPYCRSVNLPLSWWSRPGYCSTCFKWLGSREYNYSEFSTTELDWLVWVANTVGELIAAAPRLSAIAHEGNFVEALNGYVNLVAGGNVAEFARLIKTPRNTVWLWCKGKNQPRLEALLKISYCLNIPLLRLLINNDLEEREPVVRLSAPTIAKARASAQTINVDQLEQQLQTVILDHECPPPSMEEVAQRLGYACRTLSRQRPELCNSISAKYLSYRKAAQLKAIDQCCHEVRQAVAELHSKNVTPSEGRVAEFLTKPGYLRYEVVRTALRQARLELEG